MFDFTILRYFVMVNHIKSNNKLCFVKMWKKVAADEYEARHRTSEFRWVSMGVRVNSCLFLAYFAEAVTEAQSVRKLVPLFTTPCPRRERKAAQAERQAAPPGVLFIRKTEGGRNGTRNCWEARRQSSHGKAVLREQPSATPVCVGSFLSQTASLFVVRSHTELLFVGPRSEEICSQPTRWRRAFHPTRALRQRVQSLQLTNT